MACRVTKYRVLFNICFYIFSLDWLFFLIFYHFEERNQVGQEVWDVGLVRRRSQAVEDHVDDPLLVLKRRFRQNQQLGKLPRSQEVQNLQLCGGKGEKFSLTPAG